MTCIRGMAGPGGPSFVPMGRHLTIFSVSKALLKRQAPSCASNIFCTSHILRSPGYGMSRRSGGFTRTC